MDAEPLVRITHGNPAPDEVAAVVAVLLTRLRTAPARRPVPVSRWARSARAAGAADRPGPGAWRATALPR